MPTPVQFMSQYRKLAVNAVIEDAATGVCRSSAFHVQLRQYFMMDWDAGTEERRDYDVVTRGSNSDTWFRLYRNRIRNAAMGKGAPRDYELALEWAVRSRRIASVSQTSMQTYCDDHLGIDCSGFVTNYLIAAGRKTYSDRTVRNTGAASYYDPDHAVNDPLEIRQGDLLVWMSGTSVKRNPGHVAVVESYSAHSAAGGNMRVVEATGASAANPKLLDSMYAVERIINRSGGHPMILVVRRHGRSGSRVTVMRV
jgi:hypothetical protein